MMLRCANLWRSHSVCSLNNNWFLRPLQSGSSASDNIAAGKVHEHPKYTASGEAHPRYVPARNCTVWVQCLGNAHHRIARDSGFVPPTHPGWNVAFALMSYLPSYWPHTHGQIQNPCGRSPERYINSREGVAKLTIGIPQLTGKCVSYDKIGKCSVSFRSWVVQL
jgi:hypothetical protein